MDPSTAVRTDTLPAVATVVVPGTVAAAGWVWVALGGAPPEVLALLRGQEFVTGLSFILLSVGAGFVIDSAGSYLEVYGIDKRRADHEEMLATWWQYLTMVPPNPQAIGQNYLRRLLVTFKFELNLCVALLVGAPSIPILAWYGLVPCWRALLTLALMAGGALLSFRSALGSAHVLAETRRRLVSETWKSEPGTQPNKPLQPTSGELH